MRNFSHVETYKREISHMILLAVVPVAGIGYQRVWKHNRFHTWNLYVTFRIWNFICDYSQVKFHMWNGVCDFVQVTCHMWNSKCDFHVWNCTCGNFTCDVSNMIHVWDFPCENICVSYFLPHAYEVLIIYNMIRAYSLPVGFTCVSHSCLHTT